MRHLRNKRLRTSCTAWQGQTEWDGLGTGGRPGPESGPEPLTCGSNCYKDPSQRAPSQEDFGFGFRVAGGSRQGPCGREG